MSGSAPAYGRWTLVVINSLVFIRTEILRRERLQAAAHRGGWR
jgi:hypothetical protein